MNICFIYYVIKFSDCKDFMLYYLILISSFGFMFPELTLADLIVYWTDKVSSLGMMNTVIWLDTCEVLVICAFLGILLT